MKTTEATMIPEMTEATATYRGQVINLLDRLGRLDRMPELFDEIEYQYNERYHQLINDNAEKLTKKITTPPKPPKWWEGDVSEEVKAYDQYIQDIDNYVDGKNMVAALLVDAKKRQKGSAPIRERKKIQKIEKNNDLEL